MANSETFEKFMTNPIKPKKPSNNHAKPTKTKNINNLIVKQAKLQKELENLETEILAAKKEEAETPLATATMKTSVIYMENCYEGYWREMTDCNILKKGDKVVLIDTAQGLLWFKERPDGIYTDIDALENGLEIFGSDRKKYLENIVRL